MKKATVVLSLVLSSLMSSHLLASDANPFIAKSAKTHNVTLLNHGFSFVRRAPTNDRESRKLN